jgi:hypothetical protein
LWCRTRGSSEEFLARDTAVLDGAADGLLVAVGGGGVQGAVTGCQGIGDGMLGLLRRDLEDAETEDRRLDVVVEGDGRAGMDDLLRGLPPSRAVSPAQHLPAAVDHEQVQTAGLVEEGSTAMRDAVARQPKYFAHWTWAKPAVR